MYEQAQTRLSTVVGEGMLVELIKPNVMHRIKQDVLQFCPRFQRPDSTDCDE